MRRTGRAGAGIVIALLAAVLCGCAAKGGMVVLLPEKDNHETALTVRDSAGKQVVLDRPYAAADLTSAGPGARQSSASEVQSVFGAALAAQPQRPAQFRLYFVEGTDTFTEESKRTFESVFAELNSRPVPDIVVIGHTDLVGSDTYNEALSRARAETVRLALIRRGIASDNVVAVWRGKREPAVPTPDGKAEPLNRRVEIFVR